MEFTLCHLPQGKGTQLIISITWASCTGASHGWHSSKSTAAPMSTLYHLCASGHKPLSCSGFRMACWWTPLTTGSWIFSLPSLLLGFMLTPKEDLLALQLLIISIGTILHCKFITHIHYLIRNLDTFSSSSHCIVKFQGSEKTLHLDFLFSLFFDLKKSVLIFLNLIHSNIVLTLCIFLRLYSFFIASAISLIIINISDVLQYGI